MIGSHPAHLHVRELQPPQYGALVDDHYARTVSRKQPLLHLIYFKSIDKVRTYARLILPVSCDRKRINMSMAIHSAKQNSRELQKFFEAARIAKA